MGKLVRIYRVLLFWLISSPSVGPPTVEAFAQRRLSSGVMSLTAPRKKTSDLLFVSPEASPRTKKGLQMSDVMIPDDKHEDIRFF